jgi:hypothetical protein
VKLVSYIKYKNVKLLKFKLKLKLKLNTVPDSATDLYDLLCGLVVRGLGYRSRGPGSIPRATRFSEK